MAKKIWITLSVAACVAVLAGCPTPATGDDLWKTAFHDNFVDEDGDGVCDLCNFADVNNDGICDNFIDENGDGICDACGFVDEDGDGVSDNFTDADGDGVCDHRPEGAGQGGQAQAHAHGESQGLAHGWHQARTQSAPAPATQCTGYVDADGDGVCDTCGFVDEDADGVCDRYVDADGDGVCDRCGFVDEDGNGVCDNFVDGDGDGVCDNQPQGGHGPHGPNNNDAQGGGYVHGHGQGLTHGWYQDQNLAEKAGPGTNWIDEDGDGVCDNAGDGAGDGDGVCDGSGSEATPNRYQGSNSARARV